MARTKKVALFCASEGATYADTNIAGNAFVHVPCLSISPLKDTTKLLPTDYHTNRNFDTALEVGAMGWSFDCEVPVNGLAAAATGALGADDWFDIILTHIFGVQYSRAGLAVLSTTSSTITYDSGSHTDQDLLAVHDTGITVTGGNRTQWAMVTGGSTITPNWVTNPSASAVAYGAKSYRLDDDGGNSIQFVYRQDDVDWALYGGRCTAASIVANAGELVRMKLTFSGDSRTTSGTQPILSGIPAIAAYARVAKTLLSAFFFNTTRYPVKKMEVDFGITAAVRDSTEAAQGRAHYELIRADPKITVEPMFTNANFTLKNTPTRGRLFAQFGGGNLAGGVLNTCCLLFDEAQVMSADPVDDNGRIRNSITFKMVDPMNVYSGAVIGHPMQFARA